MWKYEVLYRENGILKNRGFGYEDQFNKFLGKLSKKANVQIVETFDGGRGIRKSY